jgi:ligand-binding sensor protein
MGATNRAWWSLGREFEPAPPEPSDEEIRIEKTVEYIWNDDRELLAAIRAVGEGDIEEAIENHAKKMIEEAKQRGVEP